MINLHISVISKSKYVISEVKTTELHLGGFILHLRNPNRKTDNGKSKSKYHTLTKSKLKGIELTKRKHQHQLQKQIIRGILKYRSMENPHLF